MAKTLIDTKVVEIGNSKEIIRSIKENNKKAKQGIRQGLFMLGASLSRAAKDSINNTDPAGRYYLVKINGVTRTHRASAPGQAPAKLTGNLKNSIFFNVKGSKQLEFGAGILSGVPESEHPKYYAAALELGTRNGRIKPRPYLIRQLNAQIRDATKYIEKEIEKEFNK